MLKSSRYFRRKQMESTAKHGVVQKTRKPRTKNVPNQLPLLNALTAGRPTRSVHTPRPPKAPIAVHRRISFPLAFTFLHSANSTKTYCHYCPKKSNLNSNVHCLTACRVIRKLLALD